MPQDTKRENDSTPPPATTPDKNTAPPSSEPKTPPTYEPPQLVKFERLEKLIVSGE